MLKPIGWRIWRFSENVPLAGTNGYRYVLHDSLPPYSHPGLRRGCDCRSHINGHRYFSFFTIR